MWCDPSPREGGGCWKIRGRRCGASGSCKDLPSGPADPGLLPLGCGVVFERPCRVFRKLCFNPTHGGEEDPVDTACKFAARGQHGYS